MELILKCCHDSPSLFFNRSWIGIYPATKMIQPVPVDYTPSAKEIIDWFEQYYLKHKTVWGYNKNGPITIP